MRSAKILGPAKRGLLAVAVAGGVLLTGADRGAQAATITHSRLFDAVGSGGPAFSPEQAHQNATLIPLPMFDPALGSLSGVEVALVPPAQANIFGRLRVLGDPALGVFATAMVRGDASFLIPGVAIAPMIDVDALGPCAEDVGGLGQCSVVLSDARSNLSFLAAVEPSSFGTYEGLGTVDVNLLLEWTTLFTPFPPYGTPFFDGSGFNIAGTLRVTYTYDDAALTPLPASLPLLLAGLSCLAWRRVRRRRVAPPAASRSS